MENAERGDLGVVDLLRRCRQIAVEVGSRGSLNRRYANVVRTGIEKESDNAVVVVANRERRGKREQDQNACKKASQVYNAEHGWRLAPAFGGRQTVGVCSVE